MTDRQSPLEQLDALIKGIDTAMLTTRQAEGKLVSRPLARLQTDFDGQLWFATAAHSDKVAEIEADPRVNVAFASAGKNTYVSISGVAAVIDDRARIEQLWSPAMNVFFPQGKEDPDLRLIRVQAESAEYWDGPGSLLGKGLYLLVAAVSDDPAALSEHETVRLR